jgi:two-component sensor histidine kinase
LVVRKARKQFGVLALKCRPVHVLASRASAGAQVASLGAHDIAYALSTNQPLWTSTGIRERHHAIRDESFMGRRSGQCAEIERAKRKPTESLDAYEYYLRGVASEREWTRKGNEEAERLFYRAIELDPDFASAHAMAAWCYAWRKTNGWVTDRAQESAEAARLARRAADLGREDAVALSVSGYALALVAHDLDAGTALIDQGCVVAAGCVAASLFIREILTYAFGMSFPAVTFYPSVLVAALLGGWLPGLFATALSTLAVWYVVLPPRFSFLLHERAHLADLIVFVVVNVGIVVLANHYRQLRMREGAEKRHIEFTLRECTHRVKNLLAVILGISTQIAKRTHNIGEFQDAFYERIQSLAQSHDLLVKRSWQSVCVKDLIIAQLAAFNNPQQIKVEGETIFLNPTATEQLGLALYELGSNSMKYGAWKHGVDVSVSWGVLEDSTLEFVWRETGAPHTTDSGRKGFGHFVLTEVVPRSLRGQGILTDKPDGITYRLSVHPQYYSRDSSSFSPGIAS